MAWWAVLLLLLLHSTPSEIFNLPRSVYEHIYRFVRAQSQCHFNDIDDQCIYLCFFCCHFVFVNGKQCEIRDNANERGNIISTLSQSSNKQCSRSLWKSINFGIGSIFIVDSVFPLHWLVCSFLQLQTGGDQTTFYISLNSIFRKMCLFWRAKV